MNRSYQWGCSSGASWWASLLGAREVDRIHFCPLSSASSAEDSAAAIIKSGRFGGCLNELAGSHVFLRLEVAVSPEVVSSGGSTINCCVLLLCILCYLGWLELNANALAANSTSNTQRQQRDWGNHGKLGEWTWNPSTLLGCLCSLSCSSHLVTLASAFLSLAMAEWRRAQGCLVSLSAARSWSKWVCRSLRRGSSSVHWEAGLPDGLLWPAVSFVFFGFRPGRFSFDHCCERDPERNRGGRVTGRARAFRLQCVFGTVPHRRVYPQEWHRCRLVHLWVPGSLVHGRLAAEGSCEEKWPLRKWKQVKNLGYLGITFPLKLALCRILLSFVVAGWSWCLRAVLGTPFLEWAVGARPQSSQQFSIASLRSKTAQIFALFFWVPLNCPSNKQKRPDVHSGSNQANSQILENTVIIRDRTAGFLATSLLSQGLTTALNMWPLKWLRLSKFNSCPRALTPWLEGRTCEGYWSWTI